MSIASEQLDYSKVSVSHPSYSYNRILPLSGNQQANITTAGGNETLFEIPSKVCNLGESRLEFSMLIPTTTASANLATIATAFSTYVFKDVVSPIRQLQLYTRSGLYLCDIPYFNNYTKCVRKYFTKLDDYLKYECNYNSYSSTVIGANPFNENNAIAGPIPGANSSVGRFLRKNNVVSAEPNIFSSNANSYQAPSFTLNQAANFPYCVNNSNLSIRHDNSLASSDFIEPQYFESSCPPQVTGQNGAYPVAVGNNPRTPPMYFQFSLPFSDIHNTLLSLNKDLYFGGEILILRIVWDNTSHICYSSNQTKLVAESFDGAIGVAATLPGLLPGGGTLGPVIPYVPDPGLGALGLTTNILVDNLTVYLAVEKNPDIANSVMNATLTDIGMSVLSDYIFPYKLNLGPSSVQSISLRFNRGHGRRLKYICAAMFNNNESLNTMYDHSNVGINGRNPAAQVDAGGAAGLVYYGDGRLNGTKLRTFYTLLNNNRLQEYDLNCLKNDDYKYILNMIDESVIQEANMYQYNRLWVENFCGGKLTDHKQNEECGLPLDIEQKWDVYYNLNGNQSINHYVFAVVQRLLTVNNKGITMI